MFILESRQIDLPHKSGMILPMILVAGTEVELSSTVFSTYRKKRAAGVFFLGGPDSPKYLVSSAPNPLQFSYHLDNLFYNF